jgi:tRNA G18 (ribose-2'-O)-methylase SpoU
MFHVQKITSLDQPELAPYRTMRRPLEHERQGIFVAEGEKVVRRLLESRFEVVSVLLPEKHLEAFRPLLEARPEKLTVYLADKKLLESLIGFSMYQGQLAVGKIPPPATLEDILSKSQKPRLLVAVDALTSAENLGALVRNCVAFGVQALIVGETSSSPFLRRAVRNSMGTIFQLPVLELNNRRGEFYESLTSGMKLGTRDHYLRSKRSGLGNHLVAGLGSQTRPSETLAQTMQSLRARGVRCIAAHPHANGKMLSQADFTGDCCIVFGSEGCGISAPVLEACDEAVAIPMPPTVDSLNVGAAAAVFLYEIACQRKKT